MAYELFFFFRYEMMAIVSLAILFFALLVFLLFVSGFVYTGKWHKYAIPKGLSKEMGHRAESVRKYGNGLDNKRVSQLCMPTARKSIK